MSDTATLKPEVVAARAHDIAVCLERGSVAEYQLLSKLGMAVRLALHLRGVPAISYSLVRNVAMYLLDFNSFAVDEVLRFLHDAEFVKLDTEGTTIKTIIPDIPYYDKLFSDIGELATLHGFSEPEWLTLVLLQRLAGSPLLQTHAYQMGAEKKLVNRVIDIGTEGAFIVNRRARGKDVLLSPTYFAESQDAYADLVASSGAQKVERILKLLKQNQGWPLAIMEKKGELAGIRLDANDLAIIRMLAGEGFVPPPAIETTHAGLNHFLFGPLPGATRLIPSKRPVYEAAMALVAAMRQGQLLPANYAIRSPVALLSSFRDRGFVQANTEAREQYRRVAELKVARLVPTSAGWARLELIERPENIEAINMAIDLVSGGEPAVQADEEIVLSLRKGEKYMESLIGRKRILKESINKPDEETEAAIESFLLRGR